MLCACNSLLIASLFTAKEHIFNFFFFFLTWLHELLWTDDMHNVKAKIPHFVFFLLKMTNETLLNREFFAFIITGGMADLGFSFVLYYLQIFPILF